MWMKYSFHFWCLTKPDLSIEISKEYSFSQDDASVIQFLPIPTYVCDLHQYNIQDRESTKTIWYRYINKIWFSDLVWKDPDS